MYIYIYIYIYICSVCVCAPSHTLYDFRPQCRECRIRVSTCARTCSGGVQDWLAWSYLNFVSHKTTKTAGGVQVAAFSNTELSNLWPFPACVRARARARARHI